MTKEKARTGPKKKVIDLREVRRLSMVGLTKEQIAGALGMSRSTFFDHMSKNPEISDAFEQGKGYGIGRVADSLFAKAVKGDTTAQTFFLKARAGWKDKLELSGNSESPIQHVVLNRAMTDKEWSEKYGKTDGKDTKD